MKTIVVVATTILLAAPLVAFGEDAEPNVAEVLRAMQKEIETLRAGQKRLAELEKEIERLRADNERLLRLEREVQRLRADNERLRKLEQEVRRLRGEAPTGDAGAPQNPPPRPTSQTARPVPAGPAASRPAPAASWSFGYDPPRGFHLHNDGTMLQLKDIFIRGFHHHDGRIHWTGVEDTFGAEAGFAPWLTQRIDRCTFRFGGEFLINLPFEQSRMPLAGGFDGNFEVDRVEIDQLYARWERGDLAVVLGKRETPFGRYGFTLLSNERSDAPFLRTDIIQWRQTGLFVEYRPSGGPLNGLAFDVGVVNGTTDLDTNSDKGLIFRVGAERETWAVGVSGKLADIGSDTLKRYANRLGVDFRVRLHERAELSGEVVWDQHGLRNDLADLSRLGERSLYGQDVYPGRYKDPVCGFGYYLNLAWMGDRCRLDLNFGSYFPETLGIATHDEPVHRGLAKLTWRLTEDISGFVVGLVENRRPVTAPIRVYEPWAVLVGIQMSK